MANPDASSRTSRILKMVSLPELRNVGRKAIRSLTISPPLTIPHTIHHQHCSCRTHTQIRYAPDIAALDYPDLFPEEVTLMTQILCYAHPSTPPLNLPIGSTWTTQIYLEKISPLIDRLPSGLKAKVPWLHSSLCPDHKKMSIMPLRSIFYAFQFELETRLFTTWLPYAYDPNTKLSPRLKAALTKVADVVGLWTEPAVFRMNFNREPTIEHRYQERQCLACILSVIGSNPTTCLLLGAMILGSFTRPTKSVRVAWCEGWLAASFGVRETERWIKDMHELGDALRAERQRSIAERKAKVAGTERRAGGLDRIGTTSKEQQDASARPARSTVVSPFVSPMNNHSSPTTTSATPQSPIRAHPPPKDSHFNEPCDLCPQKQSPTLPEEAKIPYQTTHRRPNIFQAPNTPRTPRSTHSTTTTTSPRTCAPKTTSQPPTAPANRKPKPNQATLLIPPPPPKNLPNHSSPTPSRSLSGETLTHQTLTSEPRAAPPASAKPLFKTPLRPLPPILIPKVVPEGWLLYRYESGDGESGLWARRAMKRLLELRSHRGPVQMERRG